MCFTNISSQSLFSLLHISKKDQEQQRQVYVSPYEHPEFDLFLLMELHFNQIIQQAEIQWKISPPPHHHSMDFGINNLTH
jgi:hypothetical protein